MASLIKRLFFKKQPDNIEFVKDDQISDTPYFLASAFYVTIVLFIGVPIWFMTCSTTRYSIPPINALESELLNDNTRPNIDISLIQLSSIDGNNFESLAKYLRANLKSKLITHIENVSYHINWRIRRPTKDEDRIFKSHPMQNVFINGTDKQPLLELESQLLKIHRADDKFRLFMYLIDTPHYPAFCDPQRPHTFTIGFERFVYLCPSYALTTTPDKSSTIVNLVDEVVKQVYSDSVDITRAKQILNPKADLLVSLLPESIDEKTIDNLSRLADKLHRIFDKNIKTHLYNLAEIVNIRFITQNVFSLMDNNHIDKMLVPRVTGLNSSKTEISTDTEQRVLQVAQLGQLFHRFESRICKHSSNNVNNVLLIIPDSNQPPLVFERRTKGEYSFLEGQDSNFIFVAQNDESLALNMRAIIRRLIGLSSVNLCNNCLVRRDVFFNRWELDALMGALTILKLDEIKRSLKSVHDQKLGIKIPRDISRMASEAHDMALKSIENLKTKQTLDAYRMASQAYELSEMVYFNPALIGGPDFPDELKYAVYLPLFLPLLVPFLRSLVSVVIYIYNNLITKHAKMKTN